MSNSIWNIKEIDKDSVSAIEKEFSLPSPIARIMALRGISGRDETGQFFKPSKDKMIDPFRLKDMGKAVDRLLHQKNKNKKTLIFGDYDVDGVSSASLLYLFFTSIDINTSYYIPHRDIDGYGLSKRGIDFAHEIGADLIVTCDCGMTAFDEIEYAKQKNIEVIVTDHHKPEDRIPQCVAVVNPNQIDCPYPFKGLCGAGVAFKFALAVAERLSLDLELVWSYADLVTLGTAADIVPLVNENRIIAYYGLKQIRNGKNLGIRALIGTSKLNPETITIGQILFWVTPKINAAGRLGDASRAVKLLTSKNPYHSLKIAEELNKENEKRKLITQNMENEAISMVEEELNLDMKRSIVLYKEGWNAGIIGILASRIKELYNRPTIIISIIDEVCKGSCRSIPQFDIVDALKSCNSYLDGFGGHPMAAGLTLERKNLDSFASEFENSCSSVLTKDNLIPLIYIDCKVDFSDINSRLVNFLKYLAPFGPKNSKPKFLSTGVIVDGIPKVLGKDQSTLKFCVKQREVIFEAIAFRMIEEYEKLITGNRLDIVYTISENHWNGKISLQLEINEIRYSDVSD